jgi:hypothetical protein
MKTGDAIASVAQPIARGVDWIFGTNVAGCSGCKQMRNNLNAGVSFAEAIYDRFWSKKEKGNNMEEELIEYHVSVAVSATGVEEALSKRSEWKVLAITPRPQVMTGRAVGVPAQTGRATVQGTHTQQ